MWTVEYTCLPSCSFAHTCEGRSLQVGIPELAYATVTRPCGIDCRSGLPWGVYTTTGPLGTAQAGLPWVVPSPFISALQRDGTLRVTHWTFANCEVRVIGRVLSFSRFSGGSLTVFRPMARVPRLVVQSLAPKPEKKGFG
uniref:Uncharacterized protein n=1 Tax=Ananas comosus var. bracteatus TaxID=296719 RepID=A0A6V7QLB2_ANACO|nr:unnamed protein product [Ananas comosus var. bracteatus]